MTGRTGDDLLTQAKEVERIGRIFNVIPLDPIKAEGVKATKTPLNNTLDTLQMYWKRDKEMIREADVLIDVTGPAKSEGVAHEIGYARYFLFKPVIRVWPSLGASISRLEDDVVVNSLEDAVIEAVYLWGTPWKRLKWRLSILNRCLLPYLATRISWLWGWV